MLHDTLIIRQLGLSPYLQTWQAMQTFTTHRTEETFDEIWLVEHHPVFTQGQAGKAEHLLNTDDISSIPIVQSDRGGQVTYHGPGQLIAYFLIDLKRKKIGVRELVTHIENIVIDTLSQNNICAHSRKEAPGVYVGEKKICSLGLRIRKGCSFHGLALNINIDLTPFTFINPCGYAGMIMTKTAELGGAVSIEAIVPLFIQQLTSHLKYEKIKHEKIKSLTKSDPS